MRKSSAIFVSAIALGLTLFAPLKASAQGVSIYIGPGYPGYGGYPVYGGYPYDAGYPGYGGYPAYGGYPGYAYPPYPRYYGAYSYPSYGYGYSRPYYGAYWGQGRRVARRVYRRNDRWD